MVIIIKKTDRKFIDYFNMKRFHFTQLQFFLLSAVKNSL